MSRTTLMSDVCYALPNRAPDGMESAGSVRALLGTAQRRLHMLMAQPLANGGAAHARVDQLGGMRVTQLMGSAGHADGGAVLLPARMRRLVAQGATAPILLCAEERTMGVARLLEVGARQREEGGIVEQYRAPALPLAQKVEALVGDRGEDRLDLRPRRPTRAWSLRMRSRSLARPTRMCWRSRSAARKRSSRWRLALRRRTVVAHRSLRETGGKVAGGEMDGSVSAQHTGPFHLGREHRSKI